MGSKLEPARKSRNGKLLLDQIFLVLLETYNL